VLHVTPTPSPKATPAQRLADRRQRVRTIRRRVGGLAAGTFLAASGGILAQLVSGHDPALAHDVSTSTSASSTATATATSDDVSRDDRTTPTAVAATPTPLTTSAS
jgi:hypothetical protein